MPNAGIFTLVSPLSEPVEMPVRNEIDTDTSMIVYIAGGLVITGVALFYILFW